MIERAAEAELELEQRIGAARQHLVTAPEPAIGLVEAALARGDGGEDRRNDGGAIGGRLGDGGRQRHQAHGVAGFVVALFDPSVKAR